MQADQCATDHDQNLLLLHNHNNHSSHSNHDNQSLLSYTAHVYVTSGMIDMVPLYFAIDFLADATSGMGGIMPNADNCNTGRSGCTIEK